MISRIVIAGGPRTGKTTFAHDMVGGDDPRDRREHADVLVLHTDNLAHLGWSEASAAAALWLDAPGPWIVEGVAAVRALRKWIAAHPDGKPCDVVYWLTDPVVERTPGQVTMAKGCATVWAEVCGELARRGVEIRCGLP